MSTCPKLSNCMDAKSIAPCGSLPSIPNPTIFTSPAIPTIKLQNPGHFIDLEGQDSDLSFRLKVRPRFRVELGPMSLLGRQLVGSRSALVQAQTWAPALQNCGSLRLGRGVQVRRATIVTMEKQREPQVQDTHPGKEHAMDPLPQHKQPGYKPAAKLEGRIALITGGDSGIGRAVGHHFALEGATVAFTYLPGPEDRDADETIDILKKTKVASAKDPLKIGVDLGFDENCKKVIDEVVEKYGRIDILVNNAGEQHTVENIEDLTPEQVERTFRTNIFSMFYLVRHALPHMKEGSAIVNSTSVNAFKGNATLLDYTATKGAIMAFTRGLALQLVKRGIRVNAVAPGPVWTPLIPSSFPAEKTEKFGSQVPMGRAGEPSEIATSYVFLASNDSSYFTGQCLHPNGGYIVNA